MRPRHPHARRRKALGAIALVGSLVAVLALAFFRLQVMSRNTYALHAESNRIRTLSVAPARGTIFDRHGRVLADNVPSYTVSVLPGSAQEVRATLERLAPYLDLDAERIGDLVRERSRRPHLPLLVEQNANLEAVSGLEERRASFPSVRIESQPRRRYLGGPATAHVLGYVGEIDLRELSSERFDDPRYQQGMIVGKTGVERQYEALLQGAPGVRYVEVDARGRIVGDVRGTVARPPRPGRDIVLNIDLELQDWIHRIFPKDRSGAIVALDPADGGVLALYSHPTFDPNDFVGGISEEVWGALGSDTLDPMLDRATQSVFPPASTFKPVVAALGLDLGVVLPDEFMPRPCTGGMMYDGRYRRCWKEQGHGFLDLAGAIRHSCDVYFYQLGLRIGLDRLLARGAELDLRGRSGVDLPSERRGVFPKDRSFWESRFGYEPREGEVLSLAIGQGPNSQTPLRMAQVYVALARDGSAPAPTLFPGRADAPPAWDLDVREEHLDVVREGLRGVTAPGGTAYLASLELWDFIGKTGTAENRASKRGEGDTDAWFIGMAGPRGDRPEIVVAVSVQGGGGGSSVAAPIAAKTADFYLRSKYGLPVDTIQTLGEHVRTGGWPEWAGRRH